VAVSMFVFCMRHGPVCFERLEALDDSMELDQYPSGSSEIFCEMVEALKMRGWIVE